MIPVPDPGQILRTLGGPVEVRVEVDTGIEGLVPGLWGEGLWDTALWGAVDAQWFDMSEWVLGVVIDGGAERWGQRFRAGTATIRVDNTTGIFTPDVDIEVPWQIPFRPGRLIRVVALPDPTDDTFKVPLFSGAIDYSNDGFGGPGGFDIDAEISCTDFMAVWAGHNPPALVTPTGVEATDERVESALDRQGWPSGERDIQTGEHTMQSSYLAQSTLEECARAADAEGGAFFCSADGKATFRARDWLLTDTRSTEVQGYLGYEEIPDGANSAHVIKWKTSWERARIINTVQMARTGGTVQSAEDLDSIAQFDRRSYQRLDLENNSDAEVLALAERLVAVSKDLRMRVDEVTVAANADSDNEDLNRVIWGSRYGDLLQVRVAPPFGWEFERQTQIMGIRHVITADDWEATFKLDDSLAALLAGSS